MFVFVAGSGKLATELLAEMKPPPGSCVLPWASSRGHTERSVIVHAGSGRELSDIFDFCTQTGSSLIDAATTSVTLPEPCPFPYISCPNANLLILRFMGMIADWGKAFRGYDIQVIESHQQTKTSPPGTALELAQALGVLADDVVSVRTPQTQLELGIPEQHLARHAFHRLMISDGCGSITLETKVLGAAPYAGGLSQIVALVADGNLSNGRHSIVELVQTGLV